MRTYVVKEVFGPTVQGEGSLVGMSTVFVRLAGCNMWDGRPETRAASACPYCDTDFLGGERMTAEDIVDAVGARSSSSTVVTISGGEPLLQVDQALVDALIAKGHGVAIETNGTRRCDLVGVHITCSPKVPRGEMKLERCDDLKVLVPHPDPRITPDAFVDFPARRRYVQPVNEDRAVDMNNVEAALRVVHREPRVWALSVQVHKLLGLP